MKPLYIISTSCISPQPSFKSSAIDLEIQVSNNNMLQCIEPDFSKYINPVQIRRMSRALKIGFTTAMECLLKEPSRIPESIVIGTGKGCLTDTEHFLHSIKEYNETALNATSFIHSTYNQLNGMIALNRKINSYNVTYVHRGFSFEHCLLDTVLLFDEGEIETSLVGSFDEMTLEHFTVKKQWGYWKQEICSSHDLLESETSGTLSGEGSAFFLLSKEKPLSTSVSIEFVSTLYKPTFDELQHELEYILSLNGLNTSDIDILLSGENGDSNYNDSYHAFEQLLPDSQVLYFKHLCGEYDTATSFACWLANDILMQQVIPDYLFHPAKDNRYSKDRMKFVLIYNNYFGLNQTMILMKFE